MRSVPYHSMVDSLNNFRMTRPDMAVVTSILSQYNNCYGPKHVAAARHLLQYAVQTKHWGLGFARSGATLKSEWVLEVWVDTTYAV